jgi:hypothetical protein
MKKRSKERLDDMAAMPADLISAMIADTGKNVPIDDDNNNEFDCDPMTGLSFGLTVIEALLLSVIDAHPLVGTDRRHRLDAAIKAILNRKASYRPLPPDPNKDWTEVDVQTESALLWMGNTYAAALNRKPTDLALATAAAEKFFPTVDANYRLSKIDDLRSRFSGAYDRKLVRWNSQTVHKVRETYAYRASQHDYILESIEHQILRRVQSELATTGLRMIVTDG